MPSYGGGLWLNDRNRVTVAIMCGNESDALDGGARQVLGAVRAEASKHVLTGAYMNKFSIVRARGREGTGREVWDRLVVNDDDGAAAIEWGHLTVPGEEGGGDRTFVPGKHIMARGLAAVKNDA